MVLLMIGSLNLSQTCKDTPTYLLRHNVEEYGSALFFPFTYETHVPHKLPRFKKMIQRQNLFPSCLPSKQPKKKLSTLVLPQYLSC